MYFESQCNLSGMSVKCGAPLFSLSLEYLPRWFGHCSIPEFESEFTTTLVSCNLVCTSLNVVFFFFLTMALACGLLVPWPGIEPVLLVLGVWSLDHWTTMSLNVVERGLLWKLVLTSLRMLVQVFCLAHGGCPVTSSHCSSLALLST